MTRYTTRAPRTEFWSDDPLLPSLSVDGEKRLDIGLVDARGRPIYRVPTPIGFGRDEEH